MATPPLTVSSTKQSVNCSASVFLYPLIPNFCRTAAPKLQSRGRFLATLSGLPSHHNLFSPLLVRLLCCTFFVAFSVVFYIFLACPATPIPMHPQEYLSWYCEAAGCQPPSPSDWAFYLALALFRLLAILAGVQQRAKMVRKAVQLLTGRVYDAHLQIGSALPAQPVDTNEQMLVAFRIQPSCLLIPDPCVLIMFPTGLSVKPTLPPLFLLKLILLFIYQSLNRSFGRIWKRIGVFCRKVA